jgi:metal-responsive CopG/Arc/MetJ family transcriptional regulator
LKPAKTIALDKFYTKGHTFGMKVAVSIPEPIFSEAEGLARRLKLSRSKVYAQALGEFVANHHAPDQLTEAINAALVEIGDQSDPFVRAAARLVFKRVEW